MADWVVTSKNGRVRVYGSRKLVRGVPRDRLNWIDGDGTQRHSTIAVYDDDPDRAKRYAQDIANKESKGKAAPSFSRGDMTAVLSARDALVGTGFSVDEACREFRKALDALENTGATVIDAAKDYAERNKAIAMPIDRAGKRMVAELKKMGRSARHCKDIARTFNNLAEAFPGRMIGSLSKREVEGYLFESKGGPVNFNNRCAALVTAFNWAMRKDYARENPASQIPKMKEKRVIDCYSADEIVKILEKCPDDLVPWVVLQAFGCMRSAEVCRVEWGKHIELKRGIIRLTSDITKTSQTRIIEMQDNLKEWLTPYAKKEGRVYEGKSEDYIGKRRRIELKKARDEAKVRPLPNGLRKSCASHLVPMCDHIGEAAEQMGHTVAEMKRSYRELRSKKEAKAYWNIQPDLPKNVSRMGKAG